MTNTSGQGRSADISGLGFIEESSTKTVAHVSEHGMRVLPVLDLMKGMVVRGVAGRRKNYWPIVTPLSSTPDPLIIAEAFRARFGLDEIYIADLDAIAGRPPACELYRTLVEKGFSLWVDAGLHTAEDAKCLLAVGVDKIIAGLETLSSSDELIRLSNLCSIEQVVFSLDLRNGQPMTASDLWKPDAFAIAEQAVSLGIRNVIVLDVAQVGTNEGLTTLDLCRRLIATFPTVSFFTGGGVRGREDLERLRDLRLAGVLVASALHDGRLTAEDLTRR